MKDYKELEKRIKNFHFNAAKPVVREWKKTDITNRVYDLELTEHFRSREERLLYRIEVWIDVCRIDSERKEKIFSHKSKDKKNSTISKLRSFSLGKMASKSVENLDSVAIEEVDTNENMDKLARRIRKEQGKERVLSTSYSTIDLRSNTKEIEEFIETADKYGTTPKRKFKFFLFRKKTKTPDSGYKNNEKEPNQMEISKNKHNNINIENDNNNKRPENIHKLRPSLFDMQSLKGSVENLERHEFNPDLKSSKQHTGNRFNTVNGLYPANNEGFKVRNDSISRQKKNNVIPAGPLFYSPSPTREEKDMGFY